MDDYHFGPGSPNPPSQPPPVSMSGPVVIKVPTWASPAEVREFEEFVRQANAALAAGVDMRRAGEWG